MHQGVHHESSAAGSAIRKAQSHLIRREDRAAVAVLRFDHGKAHALDVQLLTAFADELVDIERSQDRHAVVLTGTGSIFSAGVDLFRVLDGGDAYIDEFVPLITTAISRLFAFPRPVVAAINGHAIAGGCILACACDYRVMAHGSGTIGVPELRVGVPFPLLPIEILRFVVPAHHLQELIYLGRTYAPQEARDLGLVDEIVEPDALLDRACELAERLASGLARFTITKRQLRQPTLDLLERHAEDTRADILHVWKDPNTHAAIRAYLDATLGAALGPGKRK